MAATYYFYKGNAVFGAFHGEMMQWIDTLTFKIMVVQNNDNNIQYAII